MDPTTLVSKHLSDRKKEWTELANKPGPLQLLDLPLDVLQAIIKEITHTNDLTSLALTHSVLHRIVTPYIYSRFDIVWPDAGPTIESRVGVDALTFGLATLVMAQDVFGEIACHQINAACAKCGSLHFCQHRAYPKHPRRTRRGNNFAQFTRKFSLGNGPEDWVKEYLITKEGGKMLGTLVALAVGRMRNLESFTWDMPTGVLRDVWLALASLYGRDDGQSCRLDRVWVRWHDNQDTLISPPLPGLAPGLANLPHLVSNAGNSYFQIPPYPRVVFPTFSVLPPLKSLNVLDIDELSYVEEMSVLIERSFSKLEELRVGLARHAQNRPWARPREDRTVVPPPLVQSGEQAPRRGGLLGVLVSRFCPAFNDAIAEQSHSQQSLTERETTQTSAADPKHDSDVKAETISPGVDEDDVNQLGTLLSMQNLSDSSLQHAVSSSSIGRQSSPVSGDHNKGDQKKLQLQVLELERMCLSIPVLSRALDWSRLCTLTILGCRDHEQLWKALRKKFTPPNSSRLSASFKPSDSGSITESTSYVSNADYKLNLKRIHTDTVSAPLLAFIKDTLAPDTLECLFLQQSSAYKSIVTIDQIYKYAVRRHRGSLKKLLIDSNIRTADGSPDGNTNWRKWAVSRELITCITSGRMNLRELSISIDYKDWHYFLQRLPSAPSLRSLHISNIAEYFHTRVDASAREAALQVLDIVSLRPELELCYLGIHGKCFEILEYPNDRKVPPTPHDIAEVIPSSHLTDDDDDDISDDHDDHEPENNGNESDDFSLATDEEYADESEDETEKEKSKPALRLREILFYDDKVSIFKARHGRL